MKDQQALLDLRARVQARLAEKRAEREARLKNYRPPRYDEVYWEGLAWLESLAEAPVPEPPPEWFPRNGDEPPD